MPVSPLLTRATEMYVARVRPSGCQCAVARPGCGTHARMVTVSERYVVIEDHAGSGLAVGDVLEVVADAPPWQAVGNGGTWWHRPWMVVGGPHSGREIALGGFVDDVRGEVDWPPGWLRRVDDLVV